MAAILWSENSDFEERVLKCDSAVYCVFENFTSATNSKTI